MRSPFLRRWGGNAIRLFAGAFIAIEIGLALTGESIRSKTTGSGFAIVLLLHAITCVVLGLLLTCWLDAIDRRAARQLPAPRCNWLQVNHRRADEPSAIVVGVDVQDGRVEYQIAPWPPKATKDRGHG